MNDRELLELAAKAAAIDGFWSEGYLSFIKRSGGSWDPITDDGDALRLAVKLKMTLGVGVACGDAGDATEFDLCHRDPYAATRRAIVRAAAEIGRNTK